MVDITTSAEWKNLEAVYERTQSQTLRELFAADPQRAEKLTVDAAGLHVDLSKNLVDDRILEALTALAQDHAITLPAPLPEQIAAFEAAQEGWLRGATDDDSAPPPGTPIATPQGWRYETSLSKQFAFTPTTPDHS